MFKQIAAAAALVIASSSAIAQEAPQFYVGGEFASTDVDVIGRETGFGGYVGYNFNQNFAVEAGYGRLVDTDIEGMDVQVNQTIVSVIGTLPLSNGFNVFARLGYNDLKVKIDSESGNDTGVVYGAGLGYAFSPAVSARVELQKPASDATKLSAGVSFHF